MKNVENKVNYQTTHKSCAHKKMINGNLLVCFCHQEEIMQTNNVYDLTTQESSLNHEMMIRIICQILCTYNK